MKVYINILFFLGIFLLTTGIISTQVIGSVSIVSMVIILAGISLLIAGSLWVVYTNKAFWGKRSTEATTNALISAIAVILIIILVNFLGIKYAVKIDLTENKLFTLSPQSQELVKNLTSPLKVYVFDAPINEIDRELLENYQSYSDWFDYQFVDPQVDISLAQKFNVTRLGDVYVQYENKQQLVQIISPENRLAEVKLTTAIAKIQKNIQAKIYILQGHGEPLLQQGGQISFAQAVESLTNQGYGVEGLNLTTSPLVPPTADIVLVSSGERNLLATEVEKIKQYVDRGGNLLVMYNAQSANSLTSILSQWGVTIDDSLAIDSSGRGDIFGLGPSISIVMNYGLHPITKDFNNKMTILPWARPILITPMENIEATPLLITNNLSWGETNLTQENIEFNPTEDIPAPLNLGVALLKRNVITENEIMENEDTAINNPTTLTPEKTTPDNLTFGNNDLPTPPTMKTPKPSPSKVTSGEKNISEQKMVVVGNTNFATDGWFQQQINSDFFLNAIAWLANEKEQNLSIRPQQATNRRLDLSKNQVTLISWLAVLIIPSLSLIAAVTTWWQRNR